MQLPRQETYDERHRLLYQPFPKRKLNGFLHEGLNHTNELGDGLELSEYDQNDKEDFSRRHAPLLHESNAGPAEA